MYKTDLRLLYVGVWSGPRSQLRGGDPSPPTMPRAAVLSKRFSVKEVSNRQVLFTPDGCWTDSNYHFVKKAPDVPDTRYFRDLSRLYRDRHPDGDPGPYDKEDVDSRFCRVCYGPGPLSSEGESHFFAQGGDGHRGEVCFPARPGDRVEVA